MTLPIVIVNQYRARVPRNKLSIATMVKNGTPKSHIFQFKRLAPGGDRAKYICYVARLVKDDDPVEIVRQAYECERGKPCSFMCRGRYYSIFKKYAKGG